MLKLQTLVLKVGWSCGRKALGPTHRLSPDTGKCEVHYRERLAAQGTVWFSILATVSSKLEGSFSLICWHLLSW